MLQSNENMSQRNKSALQRNKDAIARARLPWYGELAVAVGMLVLCVVVAAVVCVALKAR